MDPRFRTDVVGRYSRKTKEQIKFDREISTGKRYVYKLKSDKSFYILKGYIIQFPFQKPNTKISKENFFCFMNEVGAAYQEYFFSKMACIISPNFIMALDLDFNVELGKDEFSYATLIIEIMFEYGGASLEMLGKIDLSTAYNLMKQSGNAFRTLHSIGITHFDIKPSNMVLKDNILKVIDLGSSYGYGMANKIYQSTMTISKKARELTEAFSPPEILKESIDANPQGIRFELGKADVYSWAMSFFAMVVGRSNEDLANDVREYKITTEEAYSEYMKKVVEPELNEIPANGENEKKMKKIIKEIIIAQLSYKMSSRSTMNEIVAKLGKLETKEITRTSSNEEKKNLDISSPQKDQPICNDCKNGKKC